MMSDFDRMDRMMSQFTGGHFGSMMPPSLPSSSSTTMNHRSQQQDMMPFGSMFGRSMFGNMDAMMSQFANSPNTQCFSSSKVISYSNTGNGAPKYYEATSESTQGPGGVRQTRKSERNSETGLNKMAIGHHIYDRGHVVERSLNRRTNEREEKHDFMNMDEEEKDSFHKEWNERATASRNRGHHNRREPRAINSSEYHRQNMERSRARHATLPQNADTRTERSAFTDTRTERPAFRHGDRGERHVRINSRPGEI